MFSSSAFTFVISSKLSSMAFLISSLTLFKLSVRHLAALKISLIRLVLTEQSLSLPDGGGPIFFAKSSASFSRPSILMMRSSPLSFVG